MKGSEYLPHLIKMRPIHYRNARTKTDVKIHLTGRKSRNDVVAKYVGKINGKRVNTTVSLGMSNFLEQGQLALKKGSTTTVKVKVDGKLSGKPYAAESLSTYRLIKFNKGTGVVQYSSEDGGTVTCDTTPESGDPGGGTDTDDGDDTGDDPEGGNDTPEDDDGPEDGGNGGFWTKLGAFLIGVGLLAVGIATGNALVLVGAASLLGGFAMDMWNGGEDVPPDEPDVPGAPGPCTKPAPG